MEFYTNTDNLSKIMQIVHGKSRISLRIIDWFVTNYAKKHFVVYDPRTVTRAQVDGEDHHSGYIRMDNGDMVYDSSGRFKVFNDYKMKLKAYSKKRFDPFCRWSRIQIPFDDQTMMETTLGQLNFFKWAIEHRVLEYIDVHYDAIERDMNTRNSNSKRRRSPQSVESRSSTEEDAMGIDEFGDNTITSNEFFQDQDDSDTKEESDPTPETSDERKIRNIVEDPSVQGTDSAGRRPEEYEVVMDDLRLRPPSDSREYRSESESKYVPEESSSTDARRKSDHIPPELPSVRGLKAPNLGVVHTEYAEGSSRASPFFRPETIGSSFHSTTRKKREELSIYACKCIKKESVKILVKFT